MKIIRQGAVCVNNYTIVYQNQDVICLEFEFHSKDVELSFYGTLNKEKINYPVLYFLENKQDLHLNKKNPHKRLTKIEFDEFPEWTIFCVDGPCHYTFRLTFRLVMMRKNHAIH